MEKIRAVMKESLEKMAVKSKILSVVAVAAVFIVMTGTAMAGQEIETAMAAADSETEKLYQSLRAKMTAEEEEPYESEIDFAELQAVNPDIYAWITVPGTNINYPVLQTAEEEDEYYLNHTVERKAELPGSIYTEKYNAKDFTDPVTVMYGHTLRDGTMFSELKKYRDTEFFKENPYFYIYLPEEKVKYQIFAAVAFDDRYILGNYNFSLPEDFDSFMAEVKGSTGGNIAGNVNQEVSVKSGDEVLILSTCIDEYPDRRWLVGAVRTEGNED